MREIITDRLVIRKFKENDGKDLHEYFSNPNVLEFEPYKPCSKEKSYIEAKRRADDERFLAVCLKSGKLIGNFYFAKEEFETWEVGYVFNDKYWGNGYATEGLLALMKLA